MALNFPLIMVGVSIQALIKTTAQSGLLKKPDAQAYRYWDFPADDLRPVDQKGQVPAHTPSYLLHCALTAMFSKRGGWGCERGQSYMYIEVVS